MGDYEEIKRGLELYGENPDYNPNVSMKSLGWDGSYSGDRAVFEDAVVDALKGGEKIARKMTNRI